MSGWEGRGVGADGLLNTILGGDKIACTRQYPLHPRVYQAPSSRESNMPHTILLHLPRDDPDRHATLATAALKPAHDYVAFTLVRVPTHTLPRAMRDLASDEVLCAQTKLNLTAATIKALRWAVHKRFDNSSKTHAQLRCDLVGGDESRLKKRNSHRNQC